MPALPASRYLLRAKDLADSRYADTVSVADLAEAARRRCCAPSIGR
jgi:hypothetical protein